MNTKYSEVTKMTLATFGTMGLLVIGSLFYEVKILDFIYLGVLIFYIIRFLLLKRV